jgi:arsenate reductase
MTLNILVLCTGNSARSILGEMLFNHLGAGRVQAWSAGSRPAGAVNPVALETLARHGVPCADARSKSWDEFAAPSTVSSSATAGRASFARPPCSAEVSSAPTFDFIFTVCGNAAKEACPVWPGHPATAHWGIDDPAHVEPLEARRAAFETAYQELKRRVEAFLALPLETMSRDEAIAAARKIHEEN